MAEQQRRPSSESLVDVRIAQAAYAIFLAGSFAVSR